MDFVFLRRHPAKVALLCILQGGPRIFFKGAKVFHIPPPPRHTESFDILPLEQKKKLQSPLPPVLMMKVKYGLYDEMVQRNV